ncbi:uncharacterized protein LOC130507801 [Raphanus sativus]|uniref:Uncharacterized protein LOC130507801 n=1 Tax=Raphanus sativus TaxID=3726 RepID=A0A9W3D3X9_RAPSA|nr:uncharacterized protein LOC130507801 [Raphanus sativus]
MLKLREVAKLFFKKEIGNGRHTSFWYDNWSDMGVLSELLGDRGIIDLGVCKEATVELAITMRRRRRHRKGFLTEIEAELTSIMSNLISDREDVCLWRGKSGFKSKFSTQETWLLLKENKAHCSWSRGVWFSHATPKFAFMTWLSMRDRMSTLDRIQKWSRGLDSTCLLCKNATESRNYLFFECSYTTQVWEHFAKGLLRHEYTNVWSEIVRLLVDAPMDKKKAFCLRYSFQAVLYALWRERNKMLHGDKLMPLPILKRTIDKGIHNRITLMKGKEAKGLDNLMQYRFSIRM